MILGARGVGRLWSCGLGSGPGFGRDAHLLDRRGGPMLGEMMMFEEIGGIVGEEVCQVVGELLVFSLHAYINR